MVVALAGKISRNTPKHFLTSTSGGSARPTSVVVMTTVAAGGGFHAREEIRYGCNFVPMLRDEMRTRCVVLVLRMVTLARRIHCTRSTVPIGANRRANQRR